MSVFYHKEIVDDFTGFIDGDLLELQMRFVVSVHLSVAVVLRVKRAPFWEFLHERLATFFAAGGSGDQVDRSARVCVRRVVRSVVNFVVVNRPQSLVAVLMRPELNVDAVFVKQRFEGEKSAEGQTRSDEGFDVRAIVAVLIAAVHRSVRESDYPRSRRAVLRLVRLNQILLQPLELIHKRFDSVVHEVINLGAEADEVNRAHVKAVEHVVTSAGHAESGAVVREIATEKN